MQQKEAIQNDKFVRLNWITQQSTLSKDFLYKQIAKGLFPRQIKLGERLSVWLQSEVDVIIKARIAGISNEEIKALVIELESARKNAEVNV